jgi:hypothetical protein
MSRIEYAADMIVDEINKDVFKTLDMESVTDAVKELSSCRYGTFSSAFLDRIIPIEFADWDYETPSTLKVFTRFAIPEEKYISKNDMDILRWWNYDGDEYSRDGVAVELSAGKIVVPIIFGEDEIIEMYIAKYGCDDIEEALEDEEENYDAIIGKLWSVPSSMESRISQYMEGQNGARSASSANRNH